MPNEVAGDDTDIAPEDRLGELADQLREFAARYDSSRDDDERREAATQQFMVVTAYLQRAGIPGEDLRPMTAVIHALFDLDRGKRQALLEKRRKGGGQPVPYDELRQRGLIAAAVTLFAQADEGPEEQKLARALQKVARRVEKSRAARNRRVVKGSRQSLVEAIRDWRDKAMAGKHDDPDTSMYRRMLETSADYEGSASYWAKWALTDGLKFYR